MRCRAMRPVLAIALPAVVALAFVQASAAQEPPPAAEPAAEPAPQIDPETADLVIEAFVHIDELRFDAQPEVRIDFFGGPDLETDSGTERVNLPRPVQPGVTYRDVGIRLWIVSVFADIDRIVAEALGEVEAGETAPPAEEEPQP